MVGEEDKPEVGHMRHHREHQLGGHIYVSARMKLRFTFLCPQAKAKTKDNSSDIIKVKKRRAFFLTYGHVITLIANANHQDISMILIAEWFWHHVVIRLTFFFFLNICCIRFTHVPFV